MMVFFMDKVFTLIILMTTILAIPLSLLVSWAIGNEIIEEIKDDDICSFSIVFKGVLMMVFLLLIIVEVAMLVGVCFLVYQEVLLLLSHKISFFNI